MRMWNRKKICQNPIIDVSLVSSIKHQHSACILTSLHRHYNLIFPEITSLLNKTDLCFNRSPLCQLELQGEVTGKKLMHPKFSSREILVSPVSEERRERWGWKEIRNHLNILHFAIISLAAVLQCYSALCSHSREAQRRRAEGCCSENNESDPEVENVTKLRSWDVPDSGQQSVALHSKQSGLNPSSKL